MEKPCQFLLRNFLMSLWLKSRRVEESKSRTLIPRDTLSLFASIGRRNDDLIKIPQRLQFESVMVSVVSRRNQEPGRFLFGDCLLNDVGFRRFDLKRGLFFSLELEFRKC